VAERIEGFPATEPVLVFTVLGHPQPGGSKKAHVIRRGGIPTGQVAVTDANPKAKSWQRDVRLAALDALDGHPAFFLEPLAVTMTFYVQRPKGHYGSGRNALTLKPSAPTYPTGRPDVLKLSRPTEDALTGVVYRDDSQVVDLSVHKRYGMPERAEITIQRAA
jgi:Holliday junction resolvase RusA-like endonuclease